jgi:hypothetical protein
MRHDEASRAGFYGKWRQPSALPFGIRPDALLMTKAFIQD